MSNIIITIAILLLPMLSSAKHEGVEFFLYDEYSSSDRCYYEFESGNKPEWSTCCTLFPASVNCRGYSPSDVCYDSMATGFNDRIIGLWWKYPSVSWQFCCDDHCTPHHLDCSASNYCLGIDGEVSVLWSAHVWTVIMVLGGLAILFTAIVVFLVFCCCASSLKSRKDKKLPQVPPPVYQQFRYTDNQHQPPMVVDMGLNGGQHKIPTARLPIFTTHNNNQTAF
eukprot:GHVH01017413.1.p1 GENE.GHVH01017413.1~~GHVH01017413.1.p1  ORF type:complete len:224 (+),score=24.20 GHVH01017413.1:190-861(+)